jgi:hypothetical protein
MMADLEITDGQELPPVTLDVTYEKVVMTPMATWDLFPGHNDPFYAQCQGQKSIYLNTVALQGFADRVATDWAGPATFIARRKMTMKASVYPGGTLTGTGRVVAQAIENGLAIRLTTQEAEVCSVETTILLPLVTPNQPFSGVERQ